MDGLLGLEHKAAGLLVPEHGVDGLLGPKHKVGELIGQEHEVPNHVILGLGQKVGRLPGLEQ